MVLLEMTNQILDAIADSINPGLALLALAFPWINRKAFQNNPKSRWFFWILTFSGLLVVYGIQFMDNTLMIWPYFGLDYSTHTAFAVSVATSLGMVSRRWLPFLIALLTAYAGLMLYLNYHSLADILTTAVVIALLTGLIHWAGGEGGLIPTTLRPDNSPVRRYQASENSHPAYALS